METFVARLAFLARTAQANALLVVRSVHRKMSAIHVSGDIMDKPVKVSVQTPVKTKSVVGMVLV